MISGDSSDNRIGSDLDGTNDGAEANLIVENIDGVRIGREPRNTLLRFNTIRDNLRHGIFVRDTSDTGNKITRNLITGNGRAAISVEALASELPPPVVAAVDGGSGSISGTGCPGCVIELFADPVDQAARYVDGGTVGVLTDGTWSVSGLFVTGPADVSVTATQRDTRGSTSRLSKAQPVDRSTQWRLVSISPDRPRAIGSRRMLVREYQLVDEGGAPVPDAAVTF